VYREIREIQVLPDPAEQVYKVLLDPLVYREFRVLQDLLELLQPFPDPQDLKEFKVPQVQPVRIPPYRVLQGLREQMEQ
jgi:hypothetical protein